MPYNNLIHKPTRESLGIKLENCCVIIDEGHNIVESIINTHNIQISSIQLQNSYAQLTGYQDKYKNRLKPKNQNRIKQLMSLIYSFLKFFKTLEQNYSKILSINDFTYSVGFDNINLFEIEEFIVKSELSKKLKGFIEKQDLVEENNKNLNSSSIYLMTSFFLSLTNIDKDCKIFVEKNKTESTIKFLLLNPNVYFKEIIDQARSVVITGV